jgi:signal transduction histidine kinase
MVWKGNFINKKKDGTLYTELAIIFPIFGEDGSVIHYAAVKRDIYKEKEVEEELLIEKRKVEEANRLKTAILTNMSHELRTPLNGILGFSTLISDSNDLEEIGEMTQYIQESGQRLLRTLNLVIEISAMESGNFQPDLHEIDINDMIRKLIKNYKEEAVKKNLKIIFDDPLTSFLITTDLKFIHGAIENLLDNAIKFTNEGWVNISVVKEASEGEDYVVINVADTGIGISEKNQKVIFEDFQQESMGYSRVYEGTGLGLSLAKKYVELLDGFIKLKSKVGEGSTFSVYIPLSNSK